MGCTSCGTASVVTNNIIPGLNRVSKNENFGDCDYTREMLENFNAYLVWFKTKGLHIKNGISSHDMNKYTGIVLSALNINNICRFKTDLDKISDVVDLIINVKNG